MLMKGLWNLPKKGHTGSVEAQNPKNGTHERDKTFHAVHTHFKHCVTLLFHSS